MNAHITDATDETFQSLVEIKDRLVMVDFWADWCGPCKALAPTLIDLAEEFADELAVVKLDIVANTATAERLGVQSIPLLVFYKEGLEVDRAVGLMSKSRLASLVEKNL